MGRHIPHKIEITLAMKCGRRCVMPDCKKDLFVTTDNAEINTAETAHIIGFSKNGPRADVCLTDSEKNSEKNLMMICANCHTKIDKDLKTYTKEVLKKIKQDHEQEVLTLMKDDVLNVAFSELDDLLEYMLSDIIQFENEYQLIKPEDKIKKNNLSEQITQLILRGMIGSSQVEEYIKDHPNPQQGNRIKKRFVQEYKRLHDKEGMRGDDLFYNLYNFASLNSNKSEKMRAGLSVLVYFFEKCEVFEK